MKFISVCILFAASRVAMAQNPSTYVVVNDPNAVAFQFPQGFKGDDSNPLILGSVFFTSGPVFNDKDIELIKVIGNNGGGVQPIVKGQSNNNSNFQKINNFATNGYTLTGKCTVTDSEQNNGNDANPPSAIKAHSCFYDLCLGPEGDFPFIPDCINIYAGSPFDLNPFATTSNGNSVLAPPFPGFIIGGSGKFRSITGSVEIVTVSGTTPSPSINGVITQRIFLDTSQPLPEVPFTE
jgi:hypothetical protein